MLTVSQSTRALCDNLAYSNEPVPIDCISEATRYLLTAYGMHSFYLSCNLFRLPLDRRSAYWFLAGALASSNIPRLDVDTYRDTSNLFTHLETSDTHSEKLCCSPRLLYPHCLHQRVILVGSRGPFNSMSHFAPPGLLTLDLQDAMMSVYDFVHANEPVPIDRINEVFGSPETEQVLRCAISTWLGDGVLVLNGSELRLA